MAAQLSLERQIREFEPYIFFEKAAVLNNHGYTGVSSMFESITQCNGFFNIITAQPTHLLQKYVAQFYCSLESDGSDPSTATTLVLQEGEEAQSVSVLGLVLKAFNLVDTGVFCKIEEIPDAAARRFYHQALIQPERSYDLSTLNWRELKPEYRVIFEFVHNVFLSYAGSNEYVTLNKLKVMVAVMEQLDVN